MKNVLLILFLFIGIAAKAQDNDTTIIDSRKSSFEHSSTMPKFKGTDAEYGAFITNNFRHPSPERENSIGGRVVLLCLFEKDGSISSIKVDSSVTKNIDAEAMRVVRLMPKFTPGTWDGKPARYLVDLHMGFYYNPGKEMTLADKAMANYLPRPAIEHAVIGNKSFSDKGIVGIDLYSGDKDVMKATHNVWLLISTNTINELTDGAYQYSNKNTSEREAFKFNGSVKTGVEIVDITDGSFTVKIDKSILNIEYSLNLKNGKRVSGRYNGKYKTEDWRNKKP